MLIGSTDGSIWLETSPKEANTKFNLSSMQQMLSSNWQIMKGNNAPPSSHLYKIFNNN